MKVNSINNYQNNNKTFGMAVKAEPKALEYIKNNLSIKDSKKFAKFVKAQKHNPVDINLSLANRPIRAKFGDVVVLDTVHEDVLSASVANEQFHTDDLNVFWKNPIIKLMEKATKFADKQNKINASIDNCFVE